MEVFVNTLPAGSPCLWLNFESGLWLGLVCCSIIIVRLSVQTPSWNFLLILTSQSICSCLTEALRWVNQFRVANLIAHSEWTIVCIAVLWDNVLFRAAKTTFTGELWLNGLLKFHFYSRPLAIFKTTWMREKANGRPSVGINKSGKTRASDSSAGFKSSKGDDEFRCGYYFIGVGCLSNRETAAG